MDEKGNLSKKTNRFIDTIILHCTASKWQQPMTVEQIDKMHRANGWAGCGYHFVIYLDGTIHDGREIYKVGAHAGKGFNTGSIGIVYVGGYDKKGKCSDTRTSAQKNSMYLLVKKLMETYPIKRVMGHRDCSPDKNGDGKITKNEWIKGCPCFEVSEFMEEYNLNKLLKK